MTTETLAIIPARGGSKRVPRKNLKEVAGKPLIAHTVHHAEQAAEIERAIVSTDDDEIAAVAEQYGGEVPFMRPSKLATDTATMADVVTHAVEWANEHTNQIDTICMLQVTSPLRTPRDIDRALQLLERTESNSVVSVSKYTNPPQWAVEETKTGYLREYFDLGALWSDNPDRTQDIPELCYPNGAVFAAPIDSWRTHESFYTPETVGYRMPPERSFDIDEPWELELVRNILN